MFSNLSIVYNFGGTRPLVNCSMACDIANTFASLSRLPMILTAKGRLFIIPIGIVILGEPVTAASVELLPLNLSPLMGSIGHAGPVVGAIMASR